MINQLDLEPEEREFLGHEISDHALEAAANDKTANTFTQAVCTPYFCRVRSWPPVAARCPSGHRGIGRRVTFEIERGLKVPCLCRPLAGRNADHAPAVSRQT